MRRLATLEEDMVSIAGKAALIDRQHLTQDDERLIKEIGQLARDRSIERYTYAKEE